MAGAAATGPGLSGFLLNVAQAVTVALLLWTATTLQRVDNNQHVDEWRLLQLEQAAGLHKGVTP